MLQGIDVSRYQGTIDWNKVKAAGAAFAFIKATQGNKYVDPVFKNNWKALTDVNLPRGAYHFFDPAYKGEEQAEHFLEVFPDEIGSLPPTLDVENAGKLDNATLTKEVQIWLAAVEQKTGRKPILYTCASFWNSHINIADPTAPAQPNAATQTGCFTPYPLWVAHYGAKTPKIPTGWSAWNFWQYSQTGKIDGVQGAVDMDWFNGDSQDLQKWIKIQ